MKSLPLLLSTAGLALANTAPTVVIKSAQMRPGTTLMDVVYRVDDPDDATVKTRALAFVDGVRSFAKVIRPVSFVEGSGENLGDAILTNADHPLTWDVAADWNIDLGQVKFEVLAMDERGLLPIEWITIPEANGEPTATVSIDTPTNGQLLDALFWQYASHDNELYLANGILSGNASSGGFNGINLINGTSVQSYSAQFIFKRMNLDVYDGYNAVLARADFRDPGSWHASNKPYEGSFFFRAIGSHSFGVANIPQGLAGVQAIASNNNHSLVLKSNGTVVKISTSSIHNVPSGLSGVVAIAAGNNHSLALKSDGTVTKWGTGSSVPSGLGGIIGIAAGYNHSLALKSDGTVIGWGDDTRGQASIPEGLAGVIAIAAGDYHSIALKSDGTIVGWGENRDGQVSIPEGLGEVVAIAAGDFHNLAIKSDGTVVGWGRNTFGEASIPDGLIGVTAIAAGDYHSIALKSDGSVVGWGRNATIPVGISGVVAIAAGGNYSLMATGKVP